MVLFPKSGDSAGRGNGIVTMMNGTLLFPTVVLDTALPAATKDLPQENMSCWSSSPPGCRRGQVHAVALASLAALMLMVITEQQAGKRAQKDYSKY